MDEQRWAEKSLYFPKVWFNRKKYDKQYMWVKINAKEGLKSHLPVQFRL